MVIHADTINKPEGADLNFASDTTYTSTTPNDTTISEGGIGGNSGGGIYYDTTMWPIDKDTIYGMDCEALAVNISNMKSVMQTGNFSANGYQAYSQCLNLMTSTYNSACVVIPQKISPIVNLPEVLPVDEPKTVNPVLETLTPPSQNPYVVPASITEKTGTTEPASIKPAVAAPNKWKNYFWIAVGVTTVLGYIAFNKDSKI